MELSKRVYWIDNLKFVLIVLVVFGHLINIIYKFDNSMTQTPLINALWQVIYTFHMPVFVFLSGYFSKNYEKSNKRMHITLILPYIVFNTLYYLMRGTISLPLIPVSAMWYLCSLIIWRIFLPYLCKIKHIITISIIIALLSNFVNCDILGRSETIKFLPFFLAGFYTSSETLNKIRNCRKSIAWGVLILSIAVIFIASITEIADTNILRYSNETILSKDLNGIVIFCGRCISGVLAVLISMALINIVPDRKSGLTIIGQNTMIIYLVHYLPFLQKVYQKLIFIKDPNIGILEMIILTVIIIYLLSRDIVIKLYNNMFGYITKLFIKDVA